MDAFEDEADEIPLLPFPVAGDDTSFASRWARFAQANGLPTDPTAAAPKVNVAELRRSALEFFSWGCVHQTEMRRRLDELLPPGIDRHRRRSGRK